MTWCASTLVHGTGGHPAQVRGRLRRDLHTELLHDLDHPQITPRLGVWNTRAMRWSGIVEPDYFQFYARRVGSPWLADVTNQTYRNRLWTDGGLVVISTLRKFGTTPVTIEVVEDEPEPPSEEWQHVAEVSLDGGGPLEILSWPGDQEPRSTHVIPAGSVRLRVHWGGLVPDVWEGMDDQGNSAEHFALVVWPAAIAPFAVLREWASWPDAGP